jgi:GT2 family glycosyltransferase
MTSILIVIPVHNRLEVTKTCLESLRNQTYRRFQTIMVDDGSTDGTRELIRREFPEVMLLEGDGNLWWTGATNLGIQEALKQAGPNDYILTLNNDTILPAGYVETLDREIGKYPDALIGSVALDNDTPDRIVEAGVDINWLTAKYTYLLQNRSFRELRSRGQSCFRPTVLPGRGTAIPVKVFGEIGLFDNKAFPHYAADYDFSLRAKKAGYDLVVGFDLRLFSLPKLSGIADTGERVPLSQAMHSFMSIRSGNNLMKRLRFAVRHAPLFLLPTFVIADTFRVILGTLLKRTTLSIN